MGYLISHPSLLSKQTSGKVGQKVNDLSYPHIRPSPIAAEKRPFSRGAQIRAHENSHMFTRKYHLILYFSIKFTHGVRQNAHFERAQ